METLKTIVKVLLKFLGGIMKIGILTWVLLMEAIEFCNWCNSDEV